MGFIIFFVKVGKGRFMACQQTCSVVRSFRSSSGNKKTIFKLHIPHLDHLPGLAHLRLQHPGHHEDRVGNLGHKK